MVECSAEPSVHGRARRRPRLTSSRRTSSAPTTASSSPRATARRSSSSRRAASIPVAALERAGATARPRRASSSSTSSRSPAPRRGRRRGLPARRARARCTARRKLAAELLLAEYADTFGVRTAINRCGVIAGPWQMGKVDQGVFTHWMLRFHFGRPLSYIGYGGTGKQVRDLLHVDDLVDLDRATSSRAPEHWDGATFNVGGGRDGSLSLLETTALCRELTGRDVEIGSVAETRPGDVRVYLSDCSRAVRAHATGGPRRTPRDVLAGHLRAGSASTNRSSATRSPDAHAHRHRHRLRRPDRLGVRPPLRRAGFDVVGVENDMRAYFFGPEASTRHDSRAARSRRSTASAAPSSTSATPTASMRLFAEHARDDRAASSTRPRSRRTTGRRREPHTDFTVNANGTLNLLEAARTHCPDATFIFTSTNKVYGDRPELPAAGRARDAARAARGPPLVRRHRPIDDVDRPLHALAVRRLEGRGRPAGPGVRPLLRHADRLLPRRLPDRARSTPARSCTASSPT